MIKTDLARFVARFPGRSLERLRFLLMLRDVARTQ